ncbi:hypothetical protein ACFL0Y_01265 [Patescibacteria group bacterium]
MKNFPRPLPDDLFKTHIPVGKAVKKLKTWKDQGAEILYLTSRKERGQIEDVKKVLKKYGFPDGQLLFRRKGEKYQDVAERILPDVLIEDDCESIGGINEMTITFVNPKIKAKIKSIPVKEFGGIDHLPDKISDLLD